MNRLIAPGLVLLVLAVLFPAFTSSRWSSDATQKKNNLMVGVAKINITPQTPVPMSGYGSRDEVFKGIHDSLYATAVVFDDANESIYQIRVRPRISWHGGSSPNAIK